MRHIRDLKPYLIRRAVPIALGVAIIGHIIYSLSDEGFKLLEWNWLFLSSLICLSVGWYFARQLPDRINSTIDRLYRRGSLQATEESLEAVKTSVRDNTKTWAYRGGWLTSLMILSVWLIVASSWRRVRWWWPLISISTPAAFLAGWYVGSAVSYGMLDRILKEQGLRLQIQPGHPDGVGGLKPLGDFYGFQALLTMMPAVFVFLWLLLFPFWPLGYDYYWQSPYELLLILSLLLQVFTFYLPMRFIHREMQRQKASYLPRADELGRHLSQLHRECAASAGPEQQASLTERIALLTPVYRNLEYMPGWPIDRELRRRFVVWGVTLCCGLLLGVPLLKILVEKFDVPPPPPMRTAEDLEERLSPPDFGRKLPVDYDWTISTLDGQEFSMTEVQGKVVFLNFWATWCAPCVAEMPSIQRLYEQLKDREVAFVCVSREDPDIVRKFVEKHEYSFPIYTLDGERPEDFISRGIPATFILSQDGYIEFQQFGSVKWDDRDSIDFINKLLDREKPSLNAGIR